MARRRFAAPFALLVLIGVTAGLFQPAFGAPPATGAPRELRSDVPFGKGDASFGRITDLPSGVRVAPSTPLQVRLLMSSVPRVGEAVTVTMQVHAFADAPGATASLKLPAGARALSGPTAESMSLAEGQTKDMTATVRFDQGGEQVIRAAAKYRVSRDMVWSDTDAVFMTVGATDSFIGWRSGDDRRLSAGQTSGPSIGGSGAEGPVAEAPVSISICWTLGSDRDGSVPPLRDAQIELWDDDSGPDDLLNTSFTGFSNGCRTASVDNADTDECCTIDVYFRVLLQRAGRYRVESYGGGVFACQTSTQANISANFNFGTWFCGGGSGNDRSVRIFNDAYRLRRFISEQGNSGSGMGGDPGQCTIRWQTGGTDGNYYLLGDGKVHLDDAAAGSRDVVTHECSHRIMHVVYGGFPPGDCPSPHFITLVSGKYCAWSEGWTYINVAAADGNPIYTFPGGGTLNLETPNCNTANWDDGGRVEGRVGGVLIDLLDPFTLSFGSVSGFSNEGAACGGDDQTGQLYDAVWDLFFDQNDDLFVTLDGVTNSYSNAWESRGLPRYAPHRIGHLNSISTFTHD